VDPNLFELGGGGPSLPVGPAAAESLPLRFDIEITATNTLRVQNNLADIAASADLRLQDTYDRPALFGRAEIERGSILFEGNRYVVTRGTIDFLTPPAGRIEPLFDIEAETRVRVPQQTYRVTLGVTGVLGKQPSLTLGSDPPLPTTDIIALLFGTTTDVSNAELRALSPEGATEAEEALLRSAGARLITGTLSAPVRRVVEETFRLDTAQITPTIGTENDPLTPSARLTLGKRLSQRAYVTFSRALGTAANDHQIIVLEYDQSDRLGFVLTQTGDRTFAIDFRVRHSF
jgi:autotransporter translocation and assembly factor TamB